MSLSTEEQILIEQRIQNDGKNIVITYLFWFFLGFFSAHRFYLGRTSSAVLQLILNILIIGLIWTFIDLFLIPGMVREDREAMRRRLTDGAMGRRSAEIAAERRVEDDLVDDI